MPSGENISSIVSAKQQLDLVIKKSRVDMYKPIQIAEVLFHSRIEEPGLEINNKETFRIKSLRWRNDVSEQLLGKSSTSSSRFQDDIWNENAMPPRLLDTLDQENKLTSGAVEKYIYLKFQQKQKTVAGIIVLLEAATPQTFKLEQLLDKFEVIPGIKRSIDKAYEIVVYSLIETVVVALKAQVIVNVPDDRQGLLNEFPDLALKILGLRSGELSYTMPAHVHRVGVTNAADRGLDMWANFGPAIQVKHMTLKPKLAQQIVDQVESDAVVIVCIDKDAQIIQTVLSQTSWGRRVRGIITENDLKDWYNRCLTGYYSNDLAHSLLNLLSSEFKREFRAAAGIISFLENRNYTTLASPEMWQVGID